MDEGASRDLIVDRLSCRWQGLGLVPDTLPGAREWLQGVAGHVVAGGLRRDARGRPRLPTGMGDIGWSHSAGRLLLAYSCSGTIGVDVERENRRVDALRIARRYFADEEIAALEALDADARSSAFLRLWCAKEAVLKAHGHGIAFGLSRVVFQLEDDKIRMTRCDPPLGDVADWRLHVLTPEPGYLAVLAWHGGILPA